MSGGAKKKGYIKVIETGVVKKFQYNPEALSDSQNINYNIISSPCSSYPVFHYVGTGEKSISLNLFVTGRTEPKEYMDFINSLLPKKKFDMPKIVIFAMGSKAYKCIITSVTNEIAEFNEDLTPNQVTISLSLLEVR